MKISICAIVVTFNRKALLVRTLAALNKQTALDKIIVIDNASTDGTQAYLEDRGFLEQANVEYHCLAQNTGGAGGFSYGVSRGFEQGFDYLWLMDDDGYPKEDCLNRLLCYCEQFDFFGPLVLSDKDRHTLSFPMNIPNYGIARNKSQLKPLYQDKQVISGALLPFNGVLLSKKMIERVGVPDARFFIWGDEIEYTKRIQKQGGGIATVFDAEFFHPTAPNLGTPMFFGRMQFNDTDSKIKLYCLCRNNSYNLKRYHGWLYALLFVLKTLWFYSFTRPSWQKLRFCLPALWHGLNADFAHHHQYIGKNFG